MDFSSYLNISKKVKELGGVKENMFNRKLTQLAEASWAKLGPEEIAQIDREIATATKINSALFMPSAVCIYDLKTFTVIPVRDVMWFYGNVVKTSTNLIPTGKTFTLWMVSRNGAFSNLGSINKAPWAKNAILTQQLDQIKAILSPYRKGILYGWSEELNQLFRGNLTAAVQMVDEHC